MSFKELLTKSLSENIERGHYKEKGTARGKEPPPKMAEARPEPKKEEPAPEKATLSKEAKPHEGLLKRVYAERDERMTSRVHDALDRKFKKKGDGK